MATVRDLLSIQAHAIQILATGAEQPTVREASQRAEDGEIVPFLVELGRSAGVDVSILESLLMPTEPDGRAVADCIASAANAIDAERAYGTPYDSPLGLLAVLGWVIDQMPDAARNADIGW